MKELDAQRISNYFAAAAIVNTAIILMVRAVSGVD